MQMTTQIEAEPDTTADLQRELSALYGDHRLHANRAGTHRAAAARMRAVATSIDHAAEPLERVLEPVVELHTPDTWEGRSADAARDRLDRHRERCRIALRSAGGLAAELRAEAGMEDARAAADEALGSGLLGRIRHLELELGHFDHI